MVSTSDKESHVVRTTILALIAVVISTTSVVQFISTERTPAPVAEVVSAATLVFLAIVTWVHKDKWLFPRIHLRRNRLAVCWIAGTLVCCAFWYNRYLGVKSTVTINGSTPEILEAERIAREMNAKAEEIRRRRTEP